jgi:cell division protein YceG involved in septum cleavage
MIRNRFPYYASLAAGILMSAVAVWMIVRSPGEIDDAAPYRPPPSPSGEPVDVTVQPGQAPASIADALEHATVIESDTQFRVLVSLMGYDRLLQAGGRLRVHAASVLDVIYRIRNGVVATRSVTVIEGWRLEEIADALDAEVSPG